jgi:hypothetical protein
MPARLVFLHFGNMSSLGIAISIAAIFVAIFMFSFAFGTLPKGGRRFSRRWARTWLRASLPRLAVATAFSVAVYVASTLSSGGSSGTADNTASGGSAACARGIPALSSEPLTADRMQQSIDDLRGTAFAATAGDLDGARAHFFGPAHNLTHDIDPPLRAVNPQLATQLCNTVLALETHLLEQKVAPTLASEAQTSADLVTRAAAALGLAK